MSAFTDTLRKNAELAEKKRVAKLNINHTLENLKCNLDGFIETGGRCNTEPIASLLKQLENQMNRVRKEIGGDL